MRTTAASPKASSAPCAKSTALAGEAVHRLRLPHIFLAALGASSYTFAYATPCEILPTGWCHGTDTAVYGGVPQLIVPNNPRALIAN